MHIAILVFLPRLPSWRRSKDRLLARVTTNGRMMPRSRRPEYCAPEVLVSDEGQARVSPLMGAVPEIDSVRRATNKLVSVVWSVMKPE